MGFWIFMLIMDLLLPFMMIGFGRYFMKKAPKEINISDRGGDIIRFFTITIFILTHEPNSS